MEFKHISIQICNNQSSGSTSCIQKAEYFDKVNFFCLIQKQLT